MTSVVAWMSLAELGISRALQNAIAGADGRRKLQELPQLILSGVVGLCIVSAFLAVFGVIVAAKVPWDIALGIAPELKAEATDAFLACTAIFVLGLPISVSATALVALQQTHRVNWSQLIAVGFNLGGLLLAIVTHMSIGWVIFLGSIGSIFSSLWLWRDLKRQLGEVRLFSSSNFKLGSLLRLSRTSIPVLTFQIGGLAVNQAVVVLLARASGLGTVTNFSVVMKLYIFLFSIGSGLSIALAPAVREAYESRDHAWAVRAISRTLYVRLGTAALLGLPLIVFGDLIVKLWTRQDLEPPLGTIGWTLVALCLLLASIGSVLSEVLIGLDDIWRQVGLVLVTALVVLSSVVAFAPEFGVSAVFGAMCTSSLLALLYCQRRLAKLLAA